MNVSRQKVGTLHFDMYAGRDTAYSLLKSGNVPLKLGRLATSRSSGSLFTFLLTFPITSIGLFFLAITRDK